MYDIDHKTIKKGNNPLDLIRFVQMLKKAILSDISKDQNNAKWIDIVQDYFETRQLNEHEKVTKQ